MTTYPFWIEHDENGNPINNVWVKLDSLPASSTKTILAYKKSGYSPDGDTVFDFFDDFDGTSVDTSKWEITSGNTPSISNSIAFLAYTRMRTNSGLISDDFVVETRVKVQYDDGKEFEIGPADFNEDGDGTWQTFFVRGVTTAYAWYESNMKYEPARTELLTNYKNIKFIKTSSTTSITIGSETKSYSWTTDPMYYINYQSVYASNGDDIYVDWVFVRKYTANEPSATITDMGTYYKIDITNNEATDLTDYQVAIPISSLDITSTTESIEFTESTAQEEKNKTIHFSHNF